MTFLLGLSGCSTQAKRVDCDWNLKPINQPAHRSAPATTPAPSKEPKANHEE